jgi:hypothetical protein
VIASLREALTRFSSAVLLRLLLFAAIFSLAAVPATDPDLWWHLANGRLLLQLHRWPLHDLYSFSASGHVWVMHEWLSDLIMYGLFRLAGLPILTVIFAALVTLGAICLYRLLRASGLHRTGAAAVTLAGALAGSPSWGARPQVFNLVLTGLLLLGLQASRRGRLSVWWLVPYLFVWANLHSAFVVGVILAALFAAGEWLDAWRTQDSGARRRAQRTGLALLAGLVAALVNPYGLQTVLFPLGTLTSPLIQANIQEWASPDFHSFPGLLLEGLLLVIIVGLGTRAVKARTSEWLWALSLLFLALSSQRQVPLFVLACAPLLGRCAQALLDRASALLPLPADLPAERTAFVFRAPLRKRPMLAVGLLNLALLLVVGAGMIAYRAVPNIRPAGEQAAIVAAFPVGTTQTLSRLGHPVRIFNYYDYGGYLVWTLYPTHARVFIDGRVEVYGASVFGDYLQINYTAPQWRQVLDRYRPDAVLFPSGHPLVGLLANDPRWRVAATDPVATLLLAAGGN